MKNTNPSTNNVVAQVNKAII